MKLQAKKTISLDPENYGRDFTAGKYYTIQEDNYIETDNGSDVQLSNEEIKELFVVN